MVIIWGKNNPGKLIFIWASWFSGYLSGGTSWSTFLDKLKYILKLYTARWFALFSAFRYFIRTIHSQFHFQTIAIQKLRKDEWVSQWNKAMNNKL